MSIVTRLARVDELTPEISECPRGSLGEDVSESACADCRYNLAFPGRPKIGCILHTPMRVLDAALAGLRKRAPILYERLQSLRGTARQPTAETAESVPRQWLSLARAWYKAAKDDADANAEHEVAAVIAHFAAGALRQGEDVEILR